MLLSIIIINYNTSDHIKMCLESIESFLKVDNLEIIVFDNNSPNRDIENLTAQFPQVMFIFNDTNLGFGSGCNEAVRHSSGKYLLFLNPDIKIFDNSISGLLDFIEKNEDAAVVSGLLVDSDGSFIYCFNDFTNLRWEFLDMIGFGHAREIKSIMNRPEISEGKNFEVDWFHGAFLLMRRKDFDSVKGFNEKYFMYYEDVELCYRMKHDLKKKNFCLPSVKVYHHTKSSLKGEKTDDIYAFHMIRGKLLFANNFLPGKKYAVKTMGFISVVIRILYLPFQGKYAGIRKEKLKQLMSVLKLYFSNSYLESSKFKYTTV